MKKILITGPSLNELENVSGISSVVENILISNEFIFFHFKLGKPDKKTRNMVWFLNQLFIPCIFIYRLLKFKPSIVHINMPLNALAMIRDSVLALISFLSFRNIIIHFHGGKYIKNKNANFLLYCFMFFLSKITHRFITLSEDEKEWLETEFKINRKNISVLVNSVSPQQIIAKESQKPVILFFGRIVISKGIEYLYEAIKLLKTENINFKFLLAGSGPDSANFVKKMKDLLGESFEFLGVVSGSQKNSVFNKSDIFVLPSLYGEGLPMALLESMSYGVIPVTTSDGAMSELVNDTTGFIVKKSDSKMLSNTLKKIILLIKSGEQNNLRKNCTAMIKEKYDINNYHKKLSKIYNEL